MGRFKGEEFMNTARTHAQHGFSQFTLTQYLLNNLQQFKLTPTAKLVLLELSSFYNPKKADMFPKQKTLAKKIGISERSVVRAIQELLNEGLIMVECKYTNHYKFTSRIVAQQPENKIFSNENMSEDLGQNDNKLNDKLAQHEPTSKPINEPSDIEEFKILKDYAIKHGARNVNAYVNVLRKNGSAAKIISDHKKQKKVTQNALRSCQETQELIKNYNEMSLDSNAPCTSDAWKKFSEKAKLRV
jgi:DNA-binding Lrp family transcriptional regulator